MQQSSTPTCVLRVFNGPMQGCEFTLQSPGILCVVAPSAHFLDAQPTPSVPPDALYIPLEHGGCNFEVLVPGNRTEGCRVLRYEAQGSVEQVLPFQQRCSVGGLVIALRPSDEPWLPDVLAHEQAGLRPSMERLQRAHRQSPWLAPVLAAVVLIAALGAIAWAVRGTPAKNIESLLAGAVGPLQVVVGPSGSVHVFAENERDVTWARQVLMRHGHPAWVVTTPYLERERLQRLLAERMPHIAYHRFDFQEPGRPHIWISQQRTPLSPDTQHQLQSLLLQAAPYATAFAVSSGDVQWLLQRAEQGLARLAVPYTKQANDISVTFSLQGSLSDTELAAVRDFVKEFHRLWGDRYVHFAVELKDDGLKGRSFHYGPNGYIKMTPSAWHFPNPY